jgi:hypothetical protein
MAKTVTDEDAVLDAYWRETWIRGTDWSLIRQYDDAWQPTLRLDHPKMTDSVRIEGLREALALAWAIVSKQSRVTAHRIWRATRRKAGVGTVGSDSSHTQPGSGGAE